MTDKYLIWSNEHSCWWNPNSAGYTRKVELAGRYDRAEAIEISRGTRLAIHWNTRRGSGFGARCTRMLCALPGDQCAGARDMRCIVCGGDHQPSPSVCNPDGMDREAARLGAKRWNALTAHVNRAVNQKAKEDASRI